MKKILIIYTQGLGDIILLYPFLYYLRIAFKESEISIIGKQNYELHKPFLFKKIYHLDTLSDSGFKEVFDFVFYLNFFSIELKQKIHANTVVFFNVPSSAKINPRIN